MARHRGRHPVSSPPVPCKRFPSAALSRAASCRPRLWTLCIEIARCVFFPLSLPPSPQHRSWISPIIKKKNELMPARGIKKKGKKKEKTCPFSPLSPCPALFARRGQFHRFPSRGTLCFFRCVPTPRLLLGLNAFLPFLCLPLRVASSVLTLWMPFCLSCPGLLVCCGPALRRFRAIWALVGLGPLPCALAPPFVHFVGAPAVLSSSPRDGFPCPTFGHPFGLAFAHLALAASIIVSSTHSSLFWKLPDRTSADLKRS